MPNRAEIEALRRHHNLTIGLFVAFWICAVAGVVAIELLELSEGTERSLMGAIFGAAIVAVMLQFAKRCPACRANLGWQVRLGVPETCGRCDADLKTPETPGDKG